MARRPASGGLPAWTAVAEALFGASLRLHPRAFREQWGEAMRQAFRDRCREVARGERGGIALAREAAADLANTACREHAIAAGTAAPSRYWLALACLVLLAVTLAARSFVSGAVLSIGEAASARWAQWQDALDARALRLYWTDVAAGLEVAATPAARTMQAFALLGAGEPGHARGPLRDAMAAGDPRAFWLAATTCQDDPDCGIDIDAALARWERLEPGNAAPALFAFERASLAGDRAGADTALARAARAEAYRAHDAELLKASFRAVGSAPVPSRLRDAVGLDADPALDADALAINAWSRLALPRFDALMARCRPATGPTPAADCVAVARRLADSTLTLGRVVGERLMCRYLCAGPERDAVAARIADTRWAFEHYGDVAWRAGWVRAWQADEVRGEFDALRFAMREQGIATVPPPDYRPPPRTLDPAR